MKNDLISRIRASKPNSRKLKNVFPEMSITIEQPEDPQQPPYGLITTFIRREHEGKYYLIPIVRQFAEIQPDPAAAPAYDLAVVEVDARLIQSDAYHIDPATHILDQNQKP